MTPDVIIRNGTVVDGTGAEPIRADVAIEGGKIAAIESIPAEAEAKSVIDAAGCLVTPGFIDVHSHSDANVLACPTCDSKIHQGVTTEIIGNCGFSAFPLRGEMLERERQEIEDLGLTPDWDDLPSYRRKLAERGHAFNVAALVGNANLRGVTGGVGNVPDTPDLIRAQTRELEAALDAGALGMSSGLIYAPSQWATCDELTALAKVLRRHDALYTSHIRGEGDRLLEAIDEACVIGERAGVRVQVSHLKASGPRNWGKVEQALERITDSDSDDRWVRFDRYPYTASSTTFASLLPPWVVDGTHDDLVARLEDESRRDEIIAHGESALESENDWAGVLIADAASEKFQELNGLSVTDAAAQTGDTPAGLWIALLIASRGHASMVAFTQSQEETDRVLDHPWGMVGSDAAVRAPTGPTSQGQPHPRAYGTFPRYLIRHVRERGTLTIAEAIRKVTSLPAAMFHLPHRGALTAGKAADVAVFRLDDLREHTTYDNPHRLSEGIRHLLVNGVAALRDGAHTGATPGEFVERG